MYYTYMSIHTYMHIHIGYLDLTPIKMQDPIDSLWIATHVTCYTN